MPSKRSKDSSKPREAQEWIVETLRELPTGARLSTTRLAKRIAKASGRKFHENSVYNALRALTRGGALGMVRSGREKLYYLQRAVPRRAAAPEPSAAAAPRVVATAPSVVPPLPHRLGLGDILILRIDNGVVLSATNLHGKLVFEHHKLDE